MEDPLHQENPPAVVVEENPQVSESAENFQKFIFDLFDKNGILNDLRAYLRGHIVDVLRSAQTGDPPACQKHFTQRLDLTFQALNILVAEYLLRLEFSYSLSVFISEIPLANMVFEFAKNLMQGNSKDKLSLRFKDRDVWSILNNLGIKCDSYYVTRILEMYKSEEYCPLLLCILKNTPMYSKESVSKGQVNCSNNSVSSSSNSLESLKEIPTKGSCNKSSLLDECRHYTSCGTCQNKITRVSEKYQRHKKNFAKNINDTKLKPQNVESLMKNISILERSLIDEMFQQLKTVYEAEVEMVKEEQQKKVKRCLANHALQLQQKHEEMDKSFKARELELESNVQQKKKFLWGLARALRDQHEHMTRAMRDVRLETDRLTDKEQSLKTQLAQAEQVLRRRGEEMRSQISNELIILETHLNSMKTERENINRERSELDHLKVLCDNKEKCMKINKTDIDDLKPHYDLLKDELSILKKYIETTRLEPKCVIERSTMTELSDVTSKLNIVLNNGRDVDYMRSDESRVGNSQVVNDLKKSKNVNFSQSNLDEIYRERSRERSRSSASSEAGDSALYRDSPHQQDILLQLKQENERLKTFASQQREHIDALSSQQARLHAALVAERCRPRSPLPHPLPRPQTAPAVTPRPTRFSHGVNMSPSSTTLNYGWREGAGEELSLFSNAQPRIYLPGDTFPFIGVLQDRDSDNRKHVINQWRMLRRHVSPVRGVSKIRVTPTSRGVREGPVSTGPSLNTNLPTHEQDGPANLQVPTEFSRPTDTRVTYQREPRMSVVLDVNTTRENSPKPVLREAKDKLRNKDNIKTSIREPNSREKSPNSVLREAKLRLRKLEIEAEAVERSYMDFRKRQSQLKNEKQCFSFVSEEPIAGHTNKELDIQKHVPLHKLDNARESDGIQQYPDFKKYIKSDFDKYLREYTPISHLETAHFRNRNLSIEQVKPIPETYSTIESIDKYNNYLDTPLYEFRKLYQSETPRSPTKEIFTTPRKSSENSKFSQRKTSFDTKTHGNKNEQKSLDENISEVLRNDSMKSVCEEINQVKINSPKLPEVNLLGAELSLNTKSWDDKVIEKIMNKNINNLHGFTDASVKSTDEEANRLLVNSSDFLEENILPIETSPNTNKSRKDKTVQEILDKNKSEFNSFINDSVKSIGEEANRSIVNSLNSPEQNLLRVEVESVSAVSGVKITESQTQDILLVVDHANNIGEIKSISDNEEKISAKMTIIVSPKRISPVDKIKQSDLRTSVSPDRETNLILNDVLDDIFRTDDDKNVSSVQMKLELSKDILDDDVISKEEMRDEEYPDDFSADVDNYNIGSDYENNSPVSLPKTSEDDNYWD